MFQRGDFAAIAASQAEREARRDREAFRPLLAAMERLLANAGEALGGAVLAGEGALLLVSGETGAPAELPLDAYCMHVYARSPLRAARRLAEAAHAADPEGLGRFAVALPRGREEATVAARQRSLVLVQGLPQHRGLPLYKMLAPIERAGQFAGTKLACVPVELLLQGALRELTQPQHAGRWLKCLEAEAWLRAQYLAGLQDNLGQVFGGRAAKAEGPLRAQRRQLRERLESDFLPAPGCVCLSRAGAQRPACVVSFASARRRLEELARALRLDLRLQESSPQVPGDARLRRLTAYLHQPGRAREAVLDVYNLPEHEAVPFVQRGRRREGTLLLRERFVLVEIWVMQLLWRMQQITAEFARAQIRALAGRLRELGEEIDAAREAAARGDTERARASGLFPASPEDWLGRIEDEVLAERRRAQAERDDKAARRLAPYFPGAHKKAEADAAADA